jgi:Xaa-Pro aminopeptidase
MSFRYFPIAEYEDRWNKVLAAMKHKGHEVALVWGKTSGVYERAGDMIYLSNFFSTHSGQEPDTALWNARGFSCVLMQQGREPQLHTDEAEVRPDVVAVKDFNGTYDVVKSVAGALKDRGIRGRVAFVGSDFVPVKYARQLESQTPGVDYVPDDDLVRDVRRIKSKRELKCFREGGEIVTKALTALMKAMLAGKTEAQAAAAAAKIVIEAGGTWHRIPISSGRHARYLESDPLVGYSTRAARAGEMFHGWIYGPIWQGYWLDPGRTAVRGKPSAAQKKMIETLVDMMTKMMAMIRPGVKVKDVALWGDKFSAESGYASEALKTNWPYYGHSNGCMWEKPYIEPRLCTDDDVFEENMVASVEAFFDRKGVGTAGYETNYVVTKKGVEEITPVKDVWW